MMKRIFALLLCVAMLAGSLVGCSGRDYGESGQSITVYLTNNVYDLDPANAYKNDALASIVGLMFDTLFVLNENGKAEPSLVKKYWTEENSATGEYKMFLRLNETKWSDGQKVISADDVLFAWQRLLEPDADFEAACLLYDIKNARAVKEGALADGSTITIDDVGISAPESDLVEIVFEHEMTKDDYNRFILNLTSVALTPLRDDVVDKKSNPETGRYEDWAKKGSSLVCSGPFKLTSIKWHAESVSEGDYVGDGTAQIISDFTLERNIYYYRDAEEDKIYKSVAPQRICVDCSLTDEQLDQAYADGLVLYVGDIPLSLRSDESSAIASAVEVATKSMSTMSIYLNQSVEPFNKKEVRQALSMAIDREALAKAVVYAEAATGLIPTGVFETTSAKSTFRDKCTEIYNTLKKDTDAAAQLLADINPSSYSFTLSCAAYDEVQCLVADSIAEAWNELGFNVTVQRVSTIQNDDMSLLTNEVPTDICDDLHAESLRSGEFEAILFDACAYSVDAYGMLAPFAKGFTGRAVDLSQEDDLEIPTHVTGFASEAYDQLIESIQNERDVTKRADLYRQAEQMLMDEMPVIPVLFNLEASATSKQLTSLDATYYVKAIFTDAYIKDYDKYLAAGAKFVTDDYNYANLKFQSSMSSAYAVQPMPEGGESSKEWTEWKKSYDEAFAVFEKATTVYSHFFAS